MCGFVVVCACLDYRPLWRCLITVFALANFEMDSPKKRAIKKVLGI
jgi:hypothetical protein